jgi:ribosome-binding protein aMBF1 (putative translation factor)
MSTMKCEICNRDGESLFIVSHRERGRIRICERCLKQEGLNLLAQKSCCCS